MRASSPDVRAWTCAGPVFNRADPDGPLLATLQIDSDLSLGESGLDQEEKWRMAEVARLTCTAGASGEAGHCRDLH